MTSRESNASGRPFVYHRRSLVTYDGERQDGPEGIGSGRRLSSVLIGNYRWSQAFEVGRDHDGSSSETVSERMRLVSLSWRNYRSLNKAVQRRGCRCGAAQSMFDVAACRLEPANLRDGLGGDSITDISPQSASLVRSLRTPPAHELRSRHREARQALRRGHRDAGLLIGARLISNEISPQEGSGAAIVA